MSAITVPEIEVAIKGKAAEALEALQRITDKEEPLDVIISALRVYEWVLAQQTNGKTLVVKPRVDMSKEDVPRLANLIRNSTEAHQYFKERDISE